MSTRGKSSFVVLFRKILMADGRLKRCRDAYDTDRSPTLWAILDAVKAIANRVEAEQPAWRPMHVNAAHQLHRHGWNVIEGDPAA